MAHTPAPWKTVVSEVDHFTNQIAVVANEGEDDEFCVYHKKAELRGNYEQHIANAALIAAAPELLAALKELVSQVEGFQDCNGDKGFVLADALAAIAKAGGAA